MNIKAMLNRLSILLALFSCSHAVAQTEAQRYASIIMLKPDKVAHYRELHAHPWPEVVKQLKEMNIHNYSIYLIEVETGKFYLFSYFEYTGKNFDHDMKKFDQNPRCRQWLEETGACQEVIPLAKRGDRWSAMQEVFHQK